MPDNIYNFPPLRTGVPLGRPVRTGQWIPVSGNLHDLSEAIAVPDDVAVDPVRAIPDPWAQLRSFADALLYPHAMLGDVVGQWRGLLALMALREEYRDIYTLSFETVDLASSGTRFAQVIKELVPRRRLPLNPANASADWLQPVIMSMRLASELAPRPIAVLNPLTLIAPGRDVHRLQVPAIPWWQKGLTDPAQLSGELALPLEQMAAIRHYVLQLRADLQMQCTTASDELTKLYEQLDKFAADCADTALQPGVAESDFELSSGDPNGVGMPPLYRNLRRNVVIGDPPLGSSACIVPLRDRLTKQPYAGLVLFDPGLQETLGRRANRIPLWGKTTLRMAMDSRAVLERIRKEVAEAGYLLVTPEDFFTDAFIKLNRDKSDGHIAAHPAGLTNALLPLSPLALLAMQPDDLRKGVAIDEEGAVTLALQVKGHGRHIIRRSYAAEPKGSEGLLLDKMAWEYGAVALWPDFVADSWSYYCARLTYPTQVDRRLRGRLATSGNAIAAMLMETTPSSEGLADPVSNEVRANLIDPWRDGKPFDGAADPLPPLAGRNFISPWLKRLRGKDFDNVIVELQTSPTAFEAIFFTIQPAKGQPLPAGMVLVSLRKPLAPPDRAGVIAVDFGTTNTVACISTESPATLQSRIVHPIGSRTPDFLKRAVADMAKNFQDFMPPDPHELPTPSVVIKRELDGDGRRALAQPLIADNLMFEHMIYFQPVPAAGETVGRLNIEDWKVLLTRTIFNLKWSADPETVTAAKRYLRQLILMLSAEAIDRGIEPQRIKWRFSRPESMGDDRNFRASIWEQIRDVIPNAPPEALEQHLRSEGLSAAKYILNSREGRAFSRSELNVILDIGGGTTDIALWSKGEAGGRPELLWSGSIRLAGGAFFTRHIINNPALLTQFGLPQWAEVLAPSNSDGSKLEPEVLRHVGELLFSGRTLNDAMAQTWPYVSDGDEVQRLLQTAYVYLGGVAWHVGTQIKRLVGDGVIDAKALDARIAVALCGRGAGLFARVQGEDANARTPISRLLALIAKAAGVADPKHASVFRSPELKIEVAAGMLDDSLDLKVAANNNDSAGRDEQDRNIPKYAAADAPMLEEMDAFLRELPRFTDFSIIMSDDQRARLAPSIADFIARDIDDNLPLQDNFIYALRELVSMVAQPRTSSIRPTITIGGK